MRAWLRWSQWDEFDRAVFIAATALGVGAVVLAPLGWAVLA